MRTPATAYRCQLSLKSVGVLWLLGCLAIQTPVLADLEDAQRMLEQRLFADARLLLNQHLADQPEDAQALLLRGIENENRLLYAEAMQDYAASLELETTAEALLRLGSAHLRGFSDQSQQTTGLALLERAAQLGNAEAQYELAIYRLNRQPDRPEYLTLLEQAANQGHLEAVLARARMYKNGLGSVADPELALSLYLDAARLGSAEAQYEVGYAYRYGVGVKTDPLQAQSWNGKAFMQGDWRAQWVLGNDLYRDGQEAMAAYEYWRSATAGFIPAQINLGLAYMNGRGVDQNYQRAASWFASASKAAPAQWYLGQLLMLGLGVEQNFEAAFELFTQAAPGVSAAKAYLCMMHLSGTGTEQNPREGRRLYQELRSSTSARALNQAAWTLATTEIDVLRNPRRALKLARTAVDLEPNAAHLDTLAAAWAAVGRFGKALDLQKQALALPVDYSEEQRQELEDHLVAYEAGAPWIERLKTRPARYEEVMEVSLLSEFTGEVIDLFPRSPERSPRGYQVSGSARFGLVVLVSRTQKGQLPHFLQDQAVFYIDSPENFFRSVYPVLPSPFSFPKGMHRFLLLQVNLRGNWYYRLELAGKQGATAETATPIVPRQSDAGSVKDADGPHLDTLTGRRSMPQRVPKSRVEGPEGLSLPDRLAVIGAH